MNYRWLASMAWVVCGAPLAADVLDDANVSLNELFRFPRPSYGPMTTETAELLAGIPLSQANEAEILAGLPGSLGYIRSFTLPGLHETRGEFDKALHAITVSPRSHLDRVRLLLRLGRVDEARAVLTDDVVRELSGRASSVYPPFTQIAGACQPLEVAESWDLLSTFLGILGEQLKSQAWQAGIWQEQTDIAWHRDLLPQLLREAAGDKFRLCVIHDRLGNRAEMKRLMEELISETKPVDLAALLPIFSGNRTLHAAAVQWWNRADLPLDARRALWTNFRSSSDQDFNAVFLEWLNKGGDAAPFADLVWKRWMGDSGEPGQAQKEAAAILHARFPDDPRFQVLLGRQLMRTNEQQAVELFTAAASSPLLLANGDLDPQQVIGDYLSFRSRDSVDDPALPGFCGLGLLNRQDKVKEVIGRQSTWQGLPAVDRAKYLAAGGMDHDLVALVMDADSTKPENEALANWLAVALSRRLATRVIPLEVFERIADKLPALALGGEGKKAKDVERDAAALFSLLAASPLDKAVVLESVTRLREAAKGRAEEQVKHHDRQLLAEAFKFPRFKQDLSPRDDTPIPRPVKNSGAVRNLQNVLALFSPPTMSRLRSPYEMLQGRQYPFTGLERSRSFAPPSTLIRWSDNWPDAGMGPPEKNEAPLIALMRLFPAGHPRRLAADVLIASKLMACGDDALRAESEATVEALIAGKLKLKGTEAFRFASLALRKADEKELLAVLEEMKLQPPAARNGFMRLLFLANLDNHEATTLARDVLTDPENQSIDKPELKDDEDGAKLREMAKQADSSPEALVLARRMLEKAVDREIEKGGEIASSDRELQHPGVDVSVALRVLKAGGALDAWRGEAADRIRKSGRSELEALKILRRLERYESSEREKHLDNARRILALDPDDHEAAQTLTPIALKEGDRELLLACIRSLKLKAFGYGSDVPGILKVFSLGHEGELLSALEVMRKKESGLDPEATGKLHDLFLSAGGEEASRFRKWLAREDLFIPRIALAGQLLKAGRRDEAVDVIAAGYQAAPEFSVNQWAFPAKKKEEQYRGSWGDAMKQEVAFLTDAELLDAVLAKIDGWKGPVSREVVTLRLVAKPDIATFEAYGVPLLGTLKENDQQQLKKQWADALPAIPASLPLRLMLAGENVAGADASADLLTASIDDASHVKGGSELIPKLWGRLKSQIGGDPGSKRDQAIEAGRRILPAMLRGADDLTWADYWTWRQSDPAQLVNPWTSEWSNGLDIFAKPARIRELLPRALRELKGKLHNQEAGRWFTAAVTADDPELLQQIMAMLSEESKSLADYRDLVAGIPDAVSPVAGAFDLESGEVTVWWNLVGSPFGNSGGMDKHVPFVNFPRLDGKLDVQILGGREAGKLFAIKKETAVPAAGHVTLKIPEEIRHVGLLVTGADGTLVRWAPVCERLSLAGKAVDLSEAHLISKGFVRMDRPGPGGLPAYHARLSKGEEIELAGIPWDGAGEVACSVWSVGSGKLTLACYDEEDQLVREIQVNGSGGWFPTWAYREIRDPGHGTIPAETVRMVLKAEGIGEGSDLAISSLLVSFGKKTELPVGFKRIGRVPGRPGAVSISPDQGKFAVGSSRGNVAIMDVATGESKQVVPTTFDSNYGEHPGFTRLEWADGFLFALDNRGSLHRIDPATMKATSFSPAKPERSYYPSEVAIASDGRSLVWRKEEGVYVLFPAGDGAPREIRLGEDAQMQVSDEGLRIFLGHDKRLFLKTEDFAAGQPGEVDPSTPRWKMDHDPRGLQHPKWTNRLHASDSLPAKRGTGEPSVVSIPVNGPQWSIASDGTLYYADRNGVIVRVTP